MDNQIIQVETPRPPAAAGGGSGGAQVEICRYYHNICMIYVHYLYMYHISNSSEHSKGLIQYQLQLGRGCLKSGAKDIHSIMAIIIASIIVIIYII